ncbi:MAG: L,D-transpeptidase [Gammaproteobacteria bacterium]|nr:L,D-transpeptidase [Gammaproteobacteria bacterium]MCP5135539.1 L,D-transpeptidase [Gammaproteobacteria bacterium]
MSDIRIHVDVASQTLELRDDERVLKRYAVSTAANGCGEENGSGCTPRGWHRVRARIGADCPEGAVFTGRRATGEIYSPELAEAFPKRDWILTRILWLTGLESGRNRGGSVDTLRRYIYIHGTPDREPMGEARSHGCIRMRNADLIELFERVPVGTRVFIAE